MNRRVGKRALIVAMTAGVLVLLLALALAPGIPAPFMLGGAQPAAAESEPSSSCTWPFAPTGDLENARRGHTATLLPSGKVLMVGGVFYYDNPLTSAELYDPATGTFMATGSLDTGRQYHTATLLPNGKVLIVGGRAAHSALPSAELYDPSTGTFALTGNLVVGRYLHTSTLLANGKVLLVGGGWSSSSASSAELYDPDSETFTLTGEPNQFRKSGHTATLLLDGKVLIVGGYYESALSGVELYDPATEMFTLSGNLTTARRQHTATLLGNGKALIAGGYASGVLFGAELYNPVTGIFALTGDLTSRRWHSHTATLLPSGKVLVAGGYDYDTPQTLSSAEVYDVDAGTFATIGDLTIARQQHTATLLGDGKVLIAGGYYTSSAELYDPTPDAEPPVGSVVINQGAIATTSANVALSLSATDNLSGLGNYRTSINGIDYDEWSNYDITPLASLGDGDGEKTIYVEFQDCAGNVSLAYTDTINLDTSVPSEYGLSINDGSLFTNQIAVTLSAGAPAYTAQMMVSNDGGFAGATWEPYATHREWQITQYGAYVIPRTVYVKYKDTGGGISSVYQDDIVLDMTPPTGSVTIVPGVGTSAAVGSSGLVGTFSDHPYKVFLPLVFRTEPNVTLLLSADDDVSGVGYMSISNDPSLVGAAWEPYASLKQWEVNETGTTTVYVKYKDNAGNVSSVYSDTITL